MAAAAGWSGGVRAEGRRTEREGKGSPVRRPWKVFPKIAEQINKMAVTNRNKIATKSTPPLHGPEDAAGGWGGGRNGAAPSSVRRVGQRQRRRGDVDAASSLRRHRRLEVDEQREGGGRSSAARRRPAFPHAAGEREGGGRGSAARLGDLRRRGPDLSHRLEDLHRRSHDRSEDDDHEHEDAVAAPLRIRAAATVLPRQRSGSARADEELGRGGEGQRATTGWRGRSQRRWRRPACWPRQTRSWIRVAAGDRGREPASVDLVGVIWGFWGRN
ncbi:hypothetical protein DAI22_03g248050 [Oryza sativa Japonica Group]|uniref:Uncharacterized protein n=1 Tax=Oryza sativa subsp. japonica TaxID=39947 RepID=Q84TY8_ORYSJ|nr:hypothetical protein [Oryza sativa Japonica Group]KAF2940129.1 hypothetical protein DAI22_03g248050 [Oryza sativa Japonica Group]